MKVSPWVLRTWCNRGSEGVYTQGGNDGEKEGGSDEPHREEGSLLKYVF